MKKTYIRILACVGLALLTLAQTDSSIAYGQYWCTRKYEMDDRQALDAEACARVARLVRGNADVHTALAAFDSNGVTPNLMGAWSLNVIIPPSGKPRFSEASQPWWPDDQCEIDGARIELIWMPVLSNEREWHGMAVAVLYGWDWNFVAQYVANIVMVNQDPNDSAWTVIYEQAVRGGQLQDAFVSRGWREEIIPGTPVGRWSPKWLLPSTRLEDSRSVSRMGEGTREGNWQAWFWAAHDWRASLSQSPGVVASSAGDSAWNSVATRWLPQMPSSVYCRLWR